jgi:hypothetical protein
MAISCLLAASAQADDLFVLTSIRAQAGNAATGGAISPVDEWIDFEEAGLSRQWTAVGQIKLARSPLAAPVDESAKPEREGPAPSGFALSISAMAPSGAYTLLGVAPAKLEEAANCELWIYRSPEEAKTRPTATIEVQFLEADGKTRFWRKADLTHQGWKRVDLPLRWFHRGDGRVPSWDNVQRFGLWLRSAGEIQVDAISFRKEEGNNAELSKDDLLKTAFAASDQRDVRAKSADGLLLMTDAAELDLDQLAERLGKVRANLNEDLAFLDRSGEAPLIVFASEQEYREFPMRLAAKLNAEAAPARSDGFTMLGIATSFYDPAQGHGRPVYSHEIAHAILTDWLRMGNKGEWLHEGLATRYQLRFHPQADVSRIVAEGLADPAKRLDLAALTSGEPIPTNRYWQAATLVDMLLADPKYSARLEKLFAAIASAGSTRLDPHVGPILETDWSTFTADWRAHCEKAFVDGDSP